MATKEEPFIDTLIYTIKTHRKSAWWIIFSAIMSYGEFLTKDLGAGLSLFGVLGLILKTHLNTALN